MTKNSHPQIENNELSSLFELAWTESRARHGSRLTAYLPGMFVVDGRRGKYRAVSITGDKCDMNCGHCKGTLLRSMEHALSPDDLKRQGQAAVARGDHGILVTGGCDQQGRLALGAIHSRDSGTKGTNRSEDNSPRGPDRSSNSSSIEGCGSRSSAGGRNRRR